MFNLRANMRYVLAVVLAVGIVAACMKSGASKEEPRQTLSNPALLKRQCEDHVGEARVEKITDRIWVATGYDLANVVLIHTDDGNVIVDAGMSLRRSQVMRAALEKVAPVAPIKAVIFTHSHIDHIGGAAAFEDEGTQIWATDEFIGHFLKQYGKFRPAETRRGMRQFGVRAGEEWIPCSALGRRIDYLGALENGIRLPTHSFTGVKVLDIGGVKIELHEAHGETHDQLFVWIPQEDTVIAGDNFYWTFPNLYTIRGTSPRPIDDWIKSLDAMRRMNPEHLVPCHTKMLHGKAEIAKALTDYRDGIQWVRDEVVRGVNAADGIDNLAEKIKLPPHLADTPYLAEMYGQVDWSVRAMFTNELGWFDGNADTLYPVPFAEAAQREIELMGGPEKIMQLADEARNKKEYRWTVHLLAKLRDSNMATGDMAKSLNDKMAQAYIKLAETVPNTNGRGYLMERAIELMEGPLELGQPNVGDEIATKIPLELIFDIMSTRLLAEKTMNVHQTVRFKFPDINKQYNVTVRYGIAEIVEGEPLPGTPDPVATVITDSLTYRKIAMGLIGPAKTVASGKLKVEGSYTKLLKFLGMFKTGV